MPIIAEMLAILPESFCARSKDSLIEADGLHWFPIGLRLKPRHLFNGKNHNRAILTLRFRMAIVLATITILS